MYVTNSWKTRKRGGQLRQLIYKVCSTSEYGVTDTLVVPAGCKIDYIISEKTDNTASATLSVGTTASGTQVVNAAALSNTCVEVDAVTVSLDGAVGAGYVALGQVKATVAATDTAAMITTSLFNALKIAGGWVNGYQYAVAQTAPTVITLTSVLPGARTVTKVEGAVNVSVDIVQTKVGSTNPSLQNLTVVASMFSATEDTTLYVTLSKVASANLFVGMSKFN